MQTKKSDVAFKRGSNNVFADLGLEDAGELLVKADLALAITTEFRDRRWTQIESAEHTGLTQSDISRLGRMKTDGFSQERLQSVLLLLGVDVEIHLRRHKGSDVGAIRVMAVTS